MDLTNFEPTYLFFGAFFPVTGGQWHRFVVQHSLSAEQGAAILQPFLQLKGVELVQNELKLGVWVAQVQIAPNWSPEDSATHQGIKSAFLAKLADGGIDASRVKLEGFI